MSQAPAHAADPALAYLADYPEASAAVAGWLYEEWYAPRGWSLRQTRELLVKRLNRRSLPLTLVALEGERPVGTASLVEDDWPDRPGSIPCLSGVFVAPWRRGQGVGSLLCLRALAEAGRLGLSSLGVYTTDRGRFYERLGWRHVMHAAIRLDDAFELAAFLERAVPPEAQEANLLEGRPADHVRRRRRP